MYIERLQQYFAANDITEEKHVAVLLSAMGGKAYSLLRSLTAPQRPAGKTFVELVQVMQEHLSPKPLLIAERFRFYKRNQCEGETISTYVAGFKKVNGALPIWGRVKRRTVRPSGMRDTS